MLMEVLTPFLIIIQMFGRKANRRVELVRLNLDVSSAIYRKALMGCKTNDIPAAVSYFNKWLISVNDERAILFLFAVLILRS